MFCIFFIILFSNVLFFTAWKPSFRGVTFGPFYLFKDNQARLPCKPLGEPQPAVKWFRDGEAITYGQNSSYTLEADGTLIIDKVKDGDGGSYTCMAQNYLGKANVTAPGILLGKKNGFKNPLL